MQGTGFDGCSHSASMSGQSIVDADEVFVDTHCHIHLEHSQTSSKDRVEEPSNIRSCIFSTDESNWQTTLDVAEREAHVAVVGIGVHPWFVTELVDGWQERLRAKLQEHAHAVVGEIGLDKAYKKDGEIVDYELQKAVFAEQLSIAASLQRPVSVHCVRTYGHLVETLQRAPELPPAIALHSFTGSAEIAQSLLRHPTTCDRIYFGFSRSVNLRGGRAGDKLAETVRDIPMESILLESDSHDRTSILQDLKQIIAVISGAKQLSQQEVLRIANTNARRMFGVFVNKPF